MGSRARYVGRFLINANNITVGAISGNLFSNVFTANIRESGNTTSGNVYLSNTRVVSALRAGTGITIEPNGVISANVNLTTLPPIFTPNVTEVGNTTSGNVYFTNTRARGAFTAGDNIVIESNGRISASFSTFSGNTSVVPEGSNLYFRDDRVYANVANTSIDVHYDVDTTTNVPLNGHVLTWNQVLSRWVPSAVGLGSTVDQANTVVFLTNHTTANLREGGSNLYFTNARVYANLLLANLDVFNDVNTAAAANNTVLVYDTTVFRWLAKPLSSIGGSANVANTVLSLAGLTTSNLVEGSNLYFTNARVYSNLLLANIDVFYDVNTAGAANGQALVWNSAIYKWVPGTATADVANTVLSLANLTTSNLVEGSNLYFNNARAVGAFTAGQNIIIYGNGLIVGQVQSFTGNTNQVPEGSANLYYTNARVYANLSLANLNVLNDVTITNVANSQILKYDTTSNQWINSNVATVLIAGDNITINPNGRISANVTAAALPTLYTSNIIEDGNPTIGNVYFTNLRARQSVGAGDTSIIYDQGNGLFRVNTTIIVNTVSNNVPNINITTDNVPPGGSADRQYFSNALALGAFRAGNNIVSSLLANGTVAVNNTPTFNVVTITNRIDTAANGINFIGSPQSGDDWANITLRAPEGGEKIRLTFWVGNDTTGSFGPDGFEFLAPQSNAIWFNGQPIWHAGNDGAGSGLDADFLDGLNSNAFVRITDSTTNLQEGSNLYFTNARVYSNILLANIDALFDVQSASASNGQVLTWDSSLTRWVARTPSATASNATFADSANTVVFLTNHTTSNLAEGSNLYFTNSRVFANILAATTNAVTEGSNLYFTNSRAQLASIPATTQLIVTTPVFNYQFDQYTGDSPNIYVYAGQTVSFDLQVGASHPFAIRTDRLANGGANVTTGLTHIAPDGTVSTGASAQGKITGKLFWKVPYALAGNTYGYQCTTHSSMYGNIVIQKALSTITTSDVPEGSNLYYTNARSRSAIFAGDSSIVYDPNTGDIRANVSASINANTDLIIRSLYLQGNVSSNSNSTGTLRVFGGVGVQGNVYGDFFYGNGALLTGITTAVTVKDEGAIVANAAKSLNFIGSAVTASTIDGSNIDITITAQSGGTTVPDTYLSRNYTGDGNTVTYAVGSNVSVNSILVVYNGVVQLPTLDYNVSNSQVIFTAPPNVASRIHIRELSTSGVTSYITPYRDKRVASGSTSSFTLDVAPQNASHALVFVNGILQDTPNNYVINNNVLTFTGTPTAGDEITVAYDVADSNYDPGIARQIAMAMLFSAY